MVGGDFPPPAQSAKPPRKGHRSGNGSRRRRQIKREHTRQANGGQQEHGSNMVRNLVPPAQSHEPPLWTSNDYVNRWQRNIRREHAASRSEGSLPRQKVFNLDGNWPPADHSFSLGKCLKLYRPPPKRRSEHINSSTPSPAEMTSQETLSSSRTWNSPTWNSYEHSY